MSLSRMDRRERRLLARPEPFVELPPPWMRKRQEEQEAHWYERWKAGYRATAWPKPNDQCDDDRFNLVEKEE